MKFDLRRLDMFGVGIKFHYDREDQYQTKFGALTTIIIIVFIGVQLILSLRNLFGQKSSEIIQTERYVSSPERFWMTNQTYQFAIGMQYPSNFSHYIDESVYTIQMLQKMKKKVFNEKTNEYDDIWSEREIPMKPCNISNVIMKEAKDFFSTISYQDMYCVANPDEEMYIEGDYNSDDYGYLRMEFKTCLNKTGDKSNCKSQEDTFNYLKHSTIAIYSLDQIVDPKQINPFLTVGKDAFWTTSPTVTKDVDIYFRNIYMQSDEGILFEDLKQYRTTKWNLQSEAYIFDETKYFFSMTIRFEKQKETLYHRKYKKIDQLLAEIGGIAKALMMIGFFFCFPINRLKLHQSLANKLFIFNQQQENYSQYQDIETLEKRQSNVGDIQNNNYNNLKNNENNQIVKNLLLLLSPNQIKTQSQKNSFRLKQYSKQDSFNLNDDKNQSKQNKINENNIIFCPNSDYQLYQNQQKMQKSKFGQTHKKSKDNNYIDYSDKVETLPTQEREQNFQKKKSFLKQKSIFVKEQISDQKLQLQWHQYLKYYLWPFGQFKGVKEKVDSSIDSILYHVDVIKIIQMQLEFEKVKNLLLNQDQIKLLKFLPKPVIGEGSWRDNNKETKSKRIDILNQEETDQTKAQDAAIAFENIINQKELSETDVKLILMLDDKYLNELMKKKIQEKFLETINERNDLIQFEEIELTDSSLESMSKIDKSEINQHVENEQNVSIKGSNQTQILKVPSPTQIKKTHSHSVQNMQFQNNLKVSQSNKIKQTRTHSEQFENYDNQTEIQNQQYLNNSNLQKQLNQDTRNSPEKLQYEIELEQTEESPRINK